MTLTNASTEPMNGMRKPKVDTFYKIKESMRLVACTGLLFTAHTPPAKQDPKAGSVQATGDTVNSSVKPFIYKAIEKQFQELAGYKLTGYDFVVDFVAEHPSMPIRFFSSKNTALEGRNNQINATAAQITWDGDQELFHAYKVLIAKVGLEWWGDITYANTPDRFQSWHLGESKYSTCTHKHNPCFYIKTHQSTYQDQTLTLGPWQLMLKTPLGHMPVLWAPSYVLEGKPQPATGFSMSSITITPDNLYNYWKQKHKTSITWLDDCGTLLGTTINYKVKSSYAHDASLEQNKKHQVNLLDITMAFLASTLYTNKDLQVKGNLACTLRSDYTDWPKLNWQNLQHSLSSTLTPWIHLQYKYDDIAFEGSINPNITWGEKELTRGAAGSIKITHENENRSVAAALESDNIFERAKLKAVCYFTYYFHCWNFTLVAKWDFNNFMPLLEFDIKPNASSLQHLT